MELNVTNASNVAAACSGSYYLSFQIWVNGYQGFTNVYHSEMDGESGYNYCSVWNVYNNAWCSSYSHSWACNAYTKGWYFDGGKCISGTCGAGTHWDNQNVENCGGPNGCNPSGDTIYQDWLRYWTTNNGQHTYAAGENCIQIC